MSETKKVLVTLPVTEEDKAYFERQAEGGSFRCLFTYLPGEEVSEEAAASFDAIIGNIAPSLLHGGAKPEWMQLNSAGAESYAGTDVLGENAVLTNAAGAYGPSVSEHMVALTFGMIRKMRGYGLLQDAHDWRALGSVTAVEESTVLVMGTGDIGTAFARLVHAMGATVWGVRRRVGECHEPFARMIALSDVHAHLGSVDVVASVLPSTDQTRGLANKDFFVAMKPGSYFVNAGRGDLVVSEDLYEALRSNHLAGAALDVTNPEPLPADHMLWQEPNALITPHVAGFWHLQATTDNVVAICKENLIRYIAGEPLRNLVAR